MHNKKIKIYLCFFIQEAFTKKREEWYSFVEKGFKKFLEDVAFAREKPLNEYGKKLSAPPYYKFKKKYGTQQYIIREKESKYTYIFYPDEWTTDSFYEIVSNFHPTLYKHLINVYFTLELEIKDVDLDLILELQDAIQGSIFIDKLEKIKQPNEGNI